MQVKYLMITSWDDHWDKIKTTYYTKKMFKEGMREELIEKGAKTIFIKLNKKTKKPEKAWIGTISNFKEDEEKIYFDVNIEKEIPVPKEYEGKPEGWYFIGESGTLEERFPSRYLFYPPFFYILIETKDWKSFENYTYYLLKLIGINDIHKYEKQRGLPDGFFKIGNLAVIYDSTLEENYVKEKEAQIKNYCSQLSNSSIKIPRSNIEIPINQCSKEVWIITRGQSRIIKTIGEITVKEVSIYSLFDIYYSRLEKVSSGKELEEKLRNIGK